VTWMALLQKKISEKPLSEEPAKPAKGVLAGLAGSPDKDFDEKNVRLTIHNRA